MWNRSCFRMRALLVYATSWNSQLFFFFLQQRWSFDRSGLLCSQGTCSKGDWRQNSKTPKENAQQDRLDVETVLCLLQEKTEQHKEKYKKKKKAVLLVFSKPKRMQNGEGLQCCREREREGSVCFFFFFFIKITDLTFPICLSFCTASQVWVTKNIQQPAAAHILKYAFSWHWISKSFC